MEQILLIIGINIFVFIAVQVRPDLLDYLALTPSQIWSQPWQVLTSVFTHYSFFHILANMYTLYFFGQVVVQLLGTTRFWLVYLMGGVMGSLFYVALGPLTGNEFTPAIGASGAIFALAGVLVVLYPKMKVTVFPIPVPMPIWIAVLGGFVVLSFLPNVAWQGHLGGLVFGLGAGYLFRQRRFSGRRPF